MPGPARRSRLVALGLSVGGLAGLVAGMVANERPAPAGGPPPATGPAVTVPDPFAAGSPATPPSSPPTSRARRTITSAS